MNDDTALTEYTLYIPIADKNGGAIYPVSRYTLQVYLYYHTRRESSLRRPLAKR